MPIVRNQDNVVLDAHHRLRACKELGIPISYSKKDFTGRPRNLLAKAEQRLQARDGRLEMEMNRKTQMTTE